MRGIVPGARDRDRVPGASTMAPEIRRIWGQIRALQRIRRRRRKCYQSAVWTRNAHLAKTFKTADSYVQLPAPPILSAGLSPLGLPCRRSRSRWGARSDRLARVAALARVIDPCTWRPSDFLDTRSRSRWGALGRVRLDSAAVPLPAPESIPKSCSSDRREGLLDGAVLRRRCGLREVPEPPRLHCLQLRLRK